MYTILIISLKTTYNTLPILSILFFGVFFFFLFFFFSFVFLGPYPQHMEIPRLWVESEPIPQPDLNHDYNPHQSSWQRRILNPLSEARN